MNLFDRSGHLSDGALRALADGTVLSELERLETAQHLGSCDDCLTQFTALLADDALLIPEHSCQATIWRRIRQRALRLLTSRYATAAAAIAIVALLSNFNVFTGLVEGSAKLSAHAPEPTAISRQLNEWNRALSDGFSRFSDLFTFDAPAASHIEPQQGGIRS